MKFLQGFLKMDRRIIFALVIVAIVVPMVYPMHLKVHSSPPVENLYREIENLKPGTPVVISFDYDPSTDAELTPMAYALIRHCFKRHLPVIAMTLDPGGAGIALNVLTRTAKEYHARPGVDYAFLGYKTGVEAVILALGRNFNLAYPADYYNVPLDKIPLMKRTRNYADVGILITLSAANYPDVWVPYARERFGVKLAAGVTAVMAPEYYPYLETGQFCGLIGGLKGAAEYEELVGEPGTGSRGMDAQAVVHALMVVMIILGNVAYFIVEQKKKRDYASQ